MDSMGQLRLMRQSIQGRELAHFARQGQLFVLVESHLKLKCSGKVIRLNPKDTDPEFYDMIAWSEVHYRPPYLAQIDEAEADRILTQWNMDRWGLFLVSNQSAEQLALHLQKFVIARGPDSDPYFFKFQDPAVLEVFLSTWNMNELRVFFGPLDSIITTALDSFQMERWQLQKDASVPLPEPEECLITLREEQLKRCYRRIEEDLVRIIGWHLRSEHGYLVQHLNQETLNMRVGFGIQKGRQYHLDTVADLAGFVGLMFEVSPNFDQHPRIQRILMSARIPPHEKLGYLVREVTEREWEEASRLFDGKNWPRIRRPAKKKAS